VALRTAASSELESYIVSRNFELLQQAGWAGDDFGAAQPNHKSQHARLDLNGVGNVAQARQTHRPNREETAKLVRKVFLAPHGEVPKMVVFCGAKRGAGCSWLCARASKILAAEVNGRVCAMDANIHSPSLHRYFDQQNAAGLTDAIHQRQPAMKFARQIRDGNLWLLPCGRPASHNFHLTPSVGLESLMSGLRAEFDYLLIDAPSVEAHPDAMVLARLADGAILVLEASGTPRELVFKAKRSIESANVPLLGVVLNQPEDSFPALLGQILK
jgi:Mrp family chromosome partitioning ATPase